MRKFVLTIFSVFALLGCKETDERSSIPDYRVNLKILYSDYTDLLTVGSYKVFTEGSTTYAFNTHLGYGGLLIFRDFDGMVRCCDLACPYCYSQEQTPYNIVMNSSLMGTCMHCKSVYDMQWGLCCPVEGPSKEKLKIYPHCKETGSSIIVNN